MTFREQRAQKARDSIIGLFCVLILVVAAFAIVPDFKDFVVCVVVGAALLGALNFSGSSDYRTRSGGQYRY